MGQTPFGVTTAGGMSQMGMSATTDMYENPDAAAAKGRIGPFSFEVDQMIETEVLAETVVREDLNELDQMMPFESNPNSKIFGRSKKRKK